MDRSEFARRRQELMNLMGKGSMAILPSAPERIRNRDVHHPYRADSNFYYLTGFAEPESLAVLVPHREQGQFLLFCRERDPEKETWHGRRAGLEGACERYGADDAFPITDIDDIVPGLLEKCRRLYYPIGCYPEFDGKVLEWLNQLREKVRIGVQIPAEMVALDHILHEMRLFKSESELQVMRQAAAVSIHAHKRVMQFCRPGLFEYELEAEITHEFLRHGSRSPAYPTIVGGGENGCILHYTENDVVLKVDDLVLIDAGAEFDYYASDITRTFPVSGRFSEPQRILYELVLKAQIAAIAKVQPGNHWNEPHETAVRVITQGLVDLGL
ncbi:MAG: Xaa-Pro aminopeptidase, partial [Beggiatoa sp. IS2]